MDSRVIVSPVCRSDTKVDKSLQLRSGIVREGRSLATISQSLWLLGLGVLLFVLSRVFATALL